MDYKEVAGAEGDAALNEQGFHGFRVADDEAGDGDIDGVLEAEAKDKDMGIPEQADDTEKGSRAVDEEDGELFDVRACGGGICFHALEKWSVVRVWRSIGNSQS